MNRLIAYTAFGLFLFWYLATTMFVDKTCVLWDEVKLQTGELTTVIRNAGAKTWDNYTVTAKILDEKDSVVATICQKVRKPLAPENRDTIKFPITKPLPQGKNFRVMAYLQRGKAGIVEQEWKSVPVFNFEMKTHRVSKSGEIKELKALKRPIQAIDVKKAMGLF